MGRELGRRILEIMKKRNMTQKELAIRLGITECAISRYISGDREIKATVLGKIAKELNTTCDFLVGMEDDEGFSYLSIYRTIEKNAMYMTVKQKCKLISALFGVE